MLEDLVGEHWLQGHGLTVRRSGKHRRETKRGFRQRSKLIADRLATMRVRMGLAQPYGDKAEKLQLGPRTPPSRRPRGAPPGQTTLDIAA